ncbi:MAG: hypothetical protein ACK4ZN_13010 [Oceanibaculum sp.]
MFLDFEKELAAMGENYKDINCKSDLFDALRKMDSPVLPRTKGRETKYTEKWVIRRLFATLASEGEVFYPLSITLRDKPDCLADMAGTKIGIEITEAITKQRAWFEALAENECPELNILEVGHFGSDAPKRSRDQMRDLLRQSQLTSDGFAGDRPEQEWATFIASIMDAKLKKLAADGFEKFDQNWLAIYDNLPLPHINLDKAIGMLRSIIGDYWNAFPCFDKIFIEHNNVLIRLSADSSDQFALCEPN